MEKTLELLNKWLKDLKEYEKEEPAQTSFEKGYFDGQEDMLIDLIEEVSRQMGY